MARIVAVVPSCSSWSTSTWTSARLSSVRSMLSTVPTGEPPISTWLSGTSWPAFWKTSVYLWPPPPLKKTIARTITATARAAITAIRAGVVPRLAAEPFSSPNGLAATDRRLLSFSGPSDPVERPQDRIRGAPGQDGAQQGLNWKSTRYSGPWEWFGEMGEAPLIPTFRREQCAERPFLIAAVAALAAAIAATAAWAGPTVSGPNGNTQSIDVQVRPKKLSKKALTPGSLEVTTLTTSTTDPSGVPVPAVHVTIDFDQEHEPLHEGPRRPATRPSFRATSTEVAEQVCGNAKIGAGHAIAYLKAGKVYEVPPDRDRLQRRPERRQADGPPPHLRDHARCRSALSWSAPSATTARKATGRALTSTSR